MTSLNGQLGDIDRIVQEIKSKPKASPLRYAEMHRRAADEEYLGLLSELERILLPALDLVGTYIRFKGDSSTMAIRPSIGWSHWAYRRKAKDMIDVAGNLSVEDVEKTLEKELPTLIIRLEQHLEQEKQRVHAQNHWAEEKQPREDFLRKVRRLANCLAESDKE